MFAIIDNIFSIATNFAVVGVLVVLVVVVVVAAAVAVVVVVVYTLLPQHLQLRLPLPAARVSS